MSKSIKKSAVASADTKELRSLAATAGIKFIGKKTEDLRKELSAVAVDDSKPSKKVKKAAKPDEKAAGKAKKAAKKEVKKDISAADRAEANKFDTKKGKVITYRERGYSIHAIAEEVGLHPTNVSRYIREAGMSTSTTKVPQERIDRIRASIAAKKPVAKAVAVKATPKKEVKKEKAVAKASKKAGKK